MRNLAVLALVAFAGCASIVHQTTQQIPVTSQPAGAALTVSCGDVHNDPKLVTPAVVTVHRKPVHCAISLTKPGYRTTEIALTRSMSAWYPANIVFGGIVGLIVDAANGAMYNRAPSQIDVSLVRVDGDAAAPAKN